MTQRLFLLIIGLLGAACGQATPILPTEETLRPTATSSLQPTPVATQLAELTNPSDMPFTTPMPPNLTIGECEGGTRPCPDDYDGWLTRITVPAGFEVTLYAALPEGAFPTVMTFAPDGTLFIATIPDPFSANNDRLGTIWRYDGVGGFEAVAEGLMIPAGLAVHPTTSDLYISHRASDTAGQLSVLRLGSQQVEPVITDLPCCYHPIYHQPNGIVFGDDGALFMAIGATSDRGPAAEMHPLEAGVLRIDLSTKQIEKYADGLRNPWGLAFDSTGTLWTVDNSPDFGPPERLHRVLPGRHYGFPYYAMYPNCPEDCEPVPENLDITPPVIEFTAHASPTGIIVYDGGQFPANYIDAVLWANWNPWAAPGIWRYDANMGVQPFMLGVFAPIDLVTMPDGGLLVAEFFFGHLFAVHWVGQ